jgi:hypothetical protein
MHEGTTYSRLETRGPWRATRTIRRSPHDTATGHRPHYSGAGLRNRREQNLKDDFRDMSDEIRHQAAAPQFTSTPRFTRAVDDVKNWLQSNCSKEALKQ